MDRTETEIAKRSQQIINDYMQLIGISSVNISMADYCSVREQAARELTNHIVSVESVSKCKNLSNIPDVYRNEPEKAPDVPVSKVSLDENTGQSQETVNSKTPLTPAFSNFVITEKSDKEKKVIKMPAGQDMDGLTERKDGVGDIKSYPGISQ